ncbi:MAG: response regulator [Dehalococcoidia bacterium]|nr:response regulator [Dehalococcoidia bacterium]
MGWNLSRVPWWGIVGNQRAGKLTVRLLEKAGHVAVGYSAGQQLLDVLASEAPDAVVTGLRLPDMSGLDLADRIRAWGEQMRRRVFIVALLRARGKLGAAAGDGALGQTRAWRSRCSHRRCITRYRGRRLRRRFAKRRRRGGVGLRCGCRDRMRPAGHCFMLQSAPQIAFPRGAAWRIRGRRCRGGQ